MARPQRNNVDYFPFYCEEGKKMFYIEETYGNEGFAVFVKILRELARTDYHFLDLSNKATKMFISAKLKVSITTMEAIINDLVELEKFDKMLWSENQIIWCQDLVDSIQDAYSKRNNQCITLEALLIHLESLGIRKPSKSTPKPLKGSSKDPVNTQSKEEYSKEDNINAHPVVNWLNKNCPNVQKLKYPITPEQADKLLLEYDKQAIKDTFLAMENKADLLKRYQNANLTIRNWLKNSKTPVKKAAGNFYQDPSEIDIKNVDWTRMPKKPDISDRKAYDEFKAKWRLNEIWQYEINAYGARTTDW